MTRPFSGIYNQKSKVLFRYLVTYLIIITVLFAAIGSFSYTNIVRAGQEKVKIEMEHAVDTVVGVMDANLRNILNIQSTFYTNSDVSRLRKLKAGFEPKEYMHFLNMSNFLARYTSTSMFLDRLTLYFHYNQLFIASDMLDSRPELFYRIKFDEEKLSYNQWRSNQLEQKKGVFFVTDDSENGYVDLYYRLPFMDDERGATVVAGLRVGELIESLGLSDIHNSSAILLVDNDENILYANRGSAMELKNLTTAATDNESFVLDNNKYEWCSQHLTLLDWTVYYFASEDDLYASSRKVQINLIGLYLFMLLGSIFLAFIFSKSISEPVASLLHIVGGWEKNDGDIASKNSNDLRYVLGKVSDMTKDYSQLAARIQEYRESSREIIYNRLLKGEIMHEDEMRMMEGESSILNYTYYAVAEVRIVEFDNNAVDMAMFAASEAFSNMRDKGFFFCKTAFDRFVLIMCFITMPDREEIKEIIENLIMEIHSNSGIDLKCGIGDTVTGHDQIFITYRNAEYTLYNMDVLDSENIAWYDSSASKKNRFTYSFDDAQRIYNIISSGDAEAAVQAVKELADRNRDVLEASKIQRDRFAFMFSETVLQLESKFADLDCEQTRQIALNLRNMKGTNDIDDILKYMSAIISIFCNSIGLRNEYRYQRLNERISGYIEEHYSDPNLGLASIANSLRLTESYISSFFKQSSGTNIHRYIEQKRMSRAAEMLKGTDYSTAEIVDKIGYNNVNTFYKAFKRYYGITPKEFKEDAK